MAWSETARRDFEEREEYRKEHGEKDRYEKKGSPAPPAGDKQPPEKPEGRSNGDWTDADYIGALTKIRYSDWGEASNAILTLRDHIRGLTQEKADYEDRIKKLRDENARLISEMTYQPAPTETENVVVEVDENKPEDIDSLWK